MRKLAFALLLVLLATTATAQMHRQPPNGGSMTGPMHFAVAADGSVIVLASADQIVALSAASGNVAWTLKVSGDPMQISTAGNAIYVMVAEPVATTTVPVRRGGARTLLAISNTGTLLWSKKIE